jgi:hypothetical protein
MKKHPILFLITTAFLFFLNEPVSFAQLVSPGQLSKAHEKLAGIKNCTKCHTLGKGITDAACKECHKKLIERIKAQKGLHARVSKCIRCHPEHRGSDADIKSFDKNKFDHKLTGYELRDRHKVPSCNKCHKANTYQGLSQACLGCHVDVHKKTVHEDCLQCHEFREWKTVQFDHNKSAKFTLTGKHTETKCDGCHRRTRVRAMIGDTEKVYEAPEFKPLNFEKCNDCHTEVHRGKFKAVCKSCHSPQGWKETVFIHNNPALSDFQLSGKHEKVSCELCHPPKTIVFKENGKNVERSIKQFKPTKHDYCYACHYDVHKGQFKERNCDDCHSLIEGWKSIAFKHESQQYTGFKLKGKHTDVDCDKCHERAEINYIEFKREKKILIGTFTLLKSENCNDCHKDDHKGSFREIEKIKDVTCKDCHSVDRKWSERKYKHTSENYKKYTRFGDVEESKCEQCHICNTDKFCISCCIENIGNFGLPVGR